MGQEELEQQALIWWVRGKSKVDDRYKNVYHPPMGGYRPTRTGKRMKKLGASAGVPDLCLAVVAPKPYGGVYGALYIEMKTKKGRLSPAQKDWARRLVDGGNAFRVCRSWTAGRDVIKAYLSGHLLTERP